MSENYNFWSMSYEFGWCTKEQLEEAEQQGQITKNELNKILGVPDQVPTNNIEDNKVTNFNDALVLPRG